MLTVFGPIIIFQIILISFVLFVLYLLLNAMLVESAARKFDRWEKPEEPENIPSKISVTSHKLLKPKQKELFLRMSLRHFGPQAKVDFSTNRDIMGGIIIQINKDTIDFSLKNRLKESGFIKESHA